MLVPAALHRTSSREAPAVCVDLRLPRSSGMQPRIPDEVDMQERPEIVAGTGSRLPCVPPVGIERARDLRGRGLLGIVARQQIADVLCDLVADLHPDALFR